MTPEEQLILAFLRSSPDSFFSRCEIARRAVKRTEYERNRNWVIRPLAALVGRKLVAIDANGYYRLRAGLAR
jgi:hypothetical protein